MGYKVDQPLGAGIGVANTTRADIWQGKLVNLTDPAAGPEAYLWVLKDKPGGSTAVLTNTTAATGTITPDINGSYLFWLYRNGVFMVEFVFRVTKDNTGADSGWALPAFDEAKTADSGGRGHAPLLEDIFDEIETSKDNYSDTKADVDAGTENAIPNTLVRRGSDGVVRQIKTAIGAVWSGQAELINTTAAADGAQQWSPGLYFTGYAWAGSLSGANSKQEWGIQNRTVQAIGDNLITSELTFVFQVDGGGFTYKFKIDNRGDVTASRYMFASAFRGVTNCDLYAGTNNLVRLYSDDGSTLLVTVGESGSDTKFDAGTRNLVLRSAGTVTLAGDATIFTKDDGTTVIGLESFSGTDAISTRVDLGGKWIFQVSDTSDGYSFRNESGDVLLGIEQNTGFLATPILTGIQFSNGGSLSLSQSQVRFEGQYHNGTVNTLAFSATPTFNFDISNHVIMAAMTANVTSITFSNRQAGAIYTIEMIQDGTGGRTVTWPASAKFVTGDDAPDATANKRTVWTFRVDEALNMDCIAVKKGLP